MRALVCTAIGGEEHLEVRDEWPEPTCGPGGVRIAVAAASVNFPDTLIIRDEYQIKVPPPFVPGNEVAGTVVEVDADVPGLAVGDRVLALTGVGAFGEQVVVSAPLQAIRIPDEMPFEHAAAFNLTYGTAGDGWRRGGLRAGETVLVLGAAGGCGSAAVQIAKAMGAEVIAVAGGAEKVALCRALGADHVLDHQQVPRLSEAVKDLTGGHGVDLLFDTVGGDDVRDNLRCLGWEGRYLVVGFAAGTVPTIRLNQTILKSIAVIGVAYGANAVRDPAGNRALFDQLFEWYREGRVTPHISHRFPLAEGAEAIRTLGRREAVGKVVVEL